jgi:hypothetical protein
VISSAVAPCDGNDAASCRQYFTIPVGGYDVMSLHLVRTGPNLTYTGADGLTHSNGGRGLVGDFYVGEADTLLRPPPLAYAQRRVVDNTTGSVEVEYFCTLTHQAGTYTIAVIPGTVGDGGFGAELLTSTAEIAIDSGVPRQGRGRFELRVRHATFVDGEMSRPNDARPGCVSYGQVRNYTLTSTGMGDANLYAEVSGGNVSRLRARCAGCDWVEATPPLSALSASPCAMRNGTTWEVQLALDTFVSATLAGLQPTEFTLATKLQNATVEAGSFVAPRAQGGSGYVCCGTTHTHLLPDVPMTSAASIQLNVTSGYVRAAFLKHGTCTDPSADIDDAVCTGLCEISWLTVYDEFYGSMQHTLRTDLTVPFGPDPWAYDALTTKRRQGDWYITVQALPGLAAEYSMAVNLLEPPRPPEVFACSRFFGFCPKRHYHEGFAVSVESSATALRASSIWASLICMVLAALTLLPRSPLPWSRSRSR